MKKARLFLITVFAVLFVVTSAVTVTAADVSAYKATLAGTPSMANEQTATFTVAVSDINVYNGLGEINIDVIIPTEYFRYVDGSANAVKLPNAEWVTNFSYASGVLTLRAYCSKVETGSALFGKYDKNYALKEDGKMEFAFLLRCVSNEESKTATVKFSSVEGRDCDRVAVEGDGNETAVNVTQIKALTPGAPTEMQVLNKPEGSVYLNYPNDVKFSEKIEFSRDLINWQASTVFTGLPNNNVYFFYARRAATQLVAASDPGPALAVTLGNATVNVDPNAELEYNDVMRVMSKTSSSITLQYVPGRSYSIDGKTWQDGITFTSLEPNKKYTVFAKDSETGQWLGTLSVTTLSLEAALPAAPELSSKTDTSVTLVSISSNEYSKDGANWQKSPVFDGLTPATTYNFYTRKAATLFVGAGATSKPLAVTTDTSKACTHKNTRTESKESTCRESGYERVVCIDCGAILSSKEFPLGEHKAEWHVVKKATCTEDGQKDLFCNVCWKTLMTEVIPAEGHDANDVRVVKEATATEDGIREIRCSKDGALIKTEVIPKTGGEIKETTDGSGASTTPVSTDKSANQPKDNGNVVLIAIILVLVAIIASIIVIFAVLSKSNKEKKR